LPRCKRISLRVFLCPLSLIFLWKSGTTVW
jgi:hypothetical protein